MLLTSKGRYAVMAIVDLAFQSKEKPIKMADIAERQEISQNYLEQIFNQLKNANIVNAVKGPGGGYILADDANNIAVSEVINAVSEPIKFTRCKSDTCSKIPGKCQTHSLWKGLEKQISNFFGNITIADICNENIDTQINTQKIAS